MADFEILLALISPSGTPGVHFVSIINDAGRYWRFVRGPVTVRSSKIWQWLARLNPLWLKAGWSIEDIPRQFANPDAVLEQYASTGSDKSNQP